MKNKKWIALAAAVGRAGTALPMGVFAAKKDSTEEKLTKVTLNEVAHSIFYAPQYVAIEEGYFAEKGLDLTLVTGFGADKTMTAVISGEADIGFMGAEASVYAYQEGATDPVVNFAQLTQRAGNFLVAREEMPDFKWEDLKGEKVLGGRKGGMPEMVFEYILKKNGIDPQKDLTIDQSIDFGSTAAAFTSDDSAAYTVEFEPSATILEKDGAGYVVASLGEASGYVPYTSYSTKASYMKENPEIIQKFTDALQKGMDYVQNHTPEEIAEVIAPQFKETDLETITATCCSIQRTVTFDGNRCVFRHRQSGANPASRTKKTIFIHIAFICETGLQHILAFQSQRHIAALDTKCAGVLLFRVGTVMHTGHVDIHAVQRDRVRTTHDGDRVRSGAIRLRDGVVTTILNQSTLALRITVRRDDNGALSQIKLPISRSLDGISPIASLRRGLSHFLWLPNCFRVLRNGHYFAFSQRRCW